MTTGDPTGKSVEFCFYLLVRDYREPKQLPDTDRSEAPSGRLGDIKGVKCLNFMQKVKRSPIGKETRKKVYESDNYMCVICHLDMHPDSDNADLITIEHVQPLCDGGTNDLENMVTCCTHCNGQRNTMFWHERKRETPSFTKSGHPRKWVPKRTSFNSIFGGAPLNEVNLAAYRELLLNGNKGIIKTAGDSKRETTAT